MAESITSSNQTNADRISAALLEDIISGKLAPGQKINEPALARTYQVSRGPLREALRHLEGLHLIRRTPRTGSRVVTLSHAELVETYEAREAMEGMAARLAAERMPEEEIRAIQTLLEQHRRQIADNAGRQYFQHEGDFDFHYRVIKSSGNDYLVNLLCGELYHLIRMYRQRSGRIAWRPQRALSEHQMILNAIRDRDGEYAEMLMRRHISTARKNLEQEYIKEADIA